MGQEIPSPIDYSLQEGGLPYGFTAKEIETKPFIPSPLLELANKRWFFSYTKKYNYNGGQITYHNGLIQGTHPLTYIDIFNKHHLLTHDFGVTDVVILLSYHEIEAFHFDLHQDKVVDVATLKQKIDDLEKDLTSTDNVVTKKPILIKSKGIWLKLDRVTFQKNAWWCKECGKPLKRLLHTLMSNNNLIRCDNMHDVGLSSDWDEEDLMKRFSIQDESEYMETLDTIYCIMCGRLQPYTVQSDMELKCVECGTIKRKE